MIAPRRPRRRGAVAAALASAAVSVAAVAGAAAMPAPSGLHVVGSDGGWQAAERFALGWTNPTEPAAAVHYRLLAPDGTVATPERRRPGGASGLELSVPPRPGAYTAEVSLEDATGAVGPAAAATLRFDDGRPGAVAPQAPAGWIGRTSFPLAVRLGPPAGPPPLSGIRGYAVAIDASPDGSPCAAAPCDEAEVDLQGGAAGGSLTVGYLPEGIAYVHAVAVSGSGMPSATVGTTALRVDETDPHVELSGVPEGWSRRPVTLRATAGDGGSGMLPLAGSPPPFTAIRVDGGAPTVATGDAVSATVIPSGVHTVAYYGRDAAGNVNDGGTSGGRPNGAPAAAVVRIDREAPALSFTPAQSPADPDLVVARAADALSGLDRGRGSIAVRRAGSGERFANLPTEVSTGALRARWDSSAVPPGEYEFRAVAYDRAGNSAASRRRADGSPMRLHAPMRVAARLRAAAARRRVPYGEGTWFGGRLTGGRRTPLAGVSVRIAERFAAGAVPALRTSTVRTGADGEFGLRLEPGPSRRVTAEVEPTATRRGARSEAVAISVVGRVALRVSAHLARVGGAPVVFRGRVASGGAVLPPGGKSVELQFRLPGAPWREFRTVRTDARGRFRYAYRFSDDDSRGVRFGFRAFAATQAGWPFGPAGSAPVAVRGA